MNTTYMYIGLAVVILAGGYFLYMPASEKQVDTSMSFFITSTNPGKGGDLGGVAGADAHCSKLAEAAGVTGKTWAAYVSTTGDGSVNARDRIGTGPWYNAKGVRIAGSVDELHSSNMLTKETALTEKGDVVLGRGDTPNMHDILTGSTEAGTASSTALTDTTCANWTSSGEGSAIVGHHDRIGINDSAPMKSWVSSHGSRGCSLDNLKATGGNGLFYCFAK
jgi:hypothetical protein